LGLWLVVIMHNYVTDFLSSVNHKRRYFGEFW